MKKASASNQGKVYNDLKEFIYRSPGKGGKLPSLRKLSSDYGFSVGSIRQALLMLEAEHLIVPQHGKGYFISQQSENTRVLVVESTIHDHLFSDFVDSFQEIISDTPTCIMQLESAEPCACKEHCRPAELLRKLDIHLNSGVNACFFDGEKVWGITPEQFMHMQKKTKFFYFNNAYPHFQQTGIPGVSTDWYVAGYKALRHLIDIGCRNIICGFTEDTDTRRGAWDAVHDSIYDVNLYFFDPRKDLGDSELYPLIKNREIDGFFTSSDMKLLGSLSLFQDCGYRKNELAMLGTFNTPWCDISEIKLSSLDVNPQKMIRMVWDMYTGKIPAAQIKLQPQLILRESTLEFQKYNSSTKGECRA